MFIRKYYNADVDTTSGGTSEETTATIAPTETPSLASLMAKAGVVNQTETMVATPIANTEIKEEPAKETVTTPAASATEPKEPSQENQESPANQEQVFGLKPQIEEPKNEATVWQEVLKNQQPEAVLKELGFDEKMVAFLNHWKQNGDVKDYLRELSTDYSKMPAEEVMKHQLRMEYPKASDKAIELLYQDEIVDKYKIDPDVYGEDEVERGRMLLEAKSEKYREQLATNQQKFLLAAPPEKAAPAPDPKVLEMQAAQKAQNDLYINTMSNHDLTRQLLTSNKLTIGEGEDKFSFPVDTQRMTNVLLDGEAFRKETYDIQKDANGKEVAVPNARKQWLVAAVATYGEDFLKEYANHYRALGGKKTIEPIENASSSDRNNIVKSEVSPTSPAAAMAKGGRVVSG